MFLEVAKAARIVGEQELDDLGADIAAAFARFLHGLPKPDSGCTAKLGLVRPLRLIGHPGAEPLVVGVRQCAEGAGVGAGHLEMLDTAGELQRGFELAGKPPSFHLHSPHHFGRVMVGAARRALPAFVMTQSIDPRWRTICRARMNACRLLCFLLLDAGVSCFTGAQDNPKSADVAALATAAPSGTKE